MRSKKQLENTIELTKNLKSLAQAYEQISVTKMQRARGKVFAARDYLEELSEIFRDVRISYQQEINNITKGKKGKNGRVSYSTLQKNGRNVSVLLSSNSKLYGDIGRKVFSYFLDSLKEKDTDIFIIGRVGKALYDQTGPKREYKYVDFPEGENTNDSMTEILKVLGQHETVTIYYGKFVNFLNQAPTEYDVSMTENANKAQPIVHKKFFFEPSLQEILSIFENQIFSSLFRQTLHESELAHVGARIHQMETALQNINQIESKLKREKRTILRREESRKQLDRLKGKNLWR